MYWVLLSNDCGAFGPFAGGTPAVPASHMTGLSKLKRQEAYRPPAYCLLPTVERLRSRFPAPDVFELLSGQRIYGQP